MGRKLVVLRNCKEDIAIFAEFFAVILAVETAYSNSWRKIWFEMDSEAMLKTFFDPNFVAPWKISKRWEGCSENASSNGRVSHIFKEGNIPADIISNVALRYPQLQWWPSRIPEIQPAVLEDRLRRACYRFV